MKKEKKKIKMTQFEQTETYKEILERGYSPTITVAYHINTGITITQDNIEAIIKAKIDEYTLKIAEVQKLVSGYVAPDIATPIRKSVEQFMNQEYCDVDYATFSSDDLLEVVAEIESSSNFKKWLVK
jgi:hypothetical protein